MLDVIAEHSPIVELGAGTGYWAAMLARRGADVIAYDIEPPTSKTNNQFFHRQYFHVAAGTHATLRDVSGERTPVHVPPRPRVTDSTAGPCPRGSRARAAARVARPR